MKLWALALVLCVGCYQSQPVYQPSAAEQYNQESEALSRIAERVEQLANLKAGAESPNPHPAIVNKWNDHQVEYVRLREARDLQEKKVSRLGMQFFSATPASASPAAQTDPD